MSVSQCCWMDNNRCSRSRLPPFESIHFIAVRCFVAPLRHKVDMSARVIGGQEQLQQSSWRGSSQGYESNKTGGRPRPPLPLTGKPGPLFQPIWDRIFGVIWSWWSPIFQSKMRTKVKLENKVLQQKISFLSFIFIQTISCHIKNSEMKEQFQTFQGWVWEGWCDPGEKLTLAGKQGLDRHQNNTPPPKQEAPCNSEDARFIWF